MTIRRIALLAAVLAGAFLGAVALRHKARAEPTLAPDPLDDLAATLPHVDDLTRDELYAWARRLDIPRRSRMRKAELADAVTSYATHGAATAQRER
jgi:hypothetical protein